MRRLHISCRKRQKCGTKFNLGFSQNVLQTSEIIDSPTTRLTPLRCRLLLALLLTAGFFAHLFYLTHNCPVDLSGDEAQYWDWSRRLGLSYYSKGPLIAYIIRASCAIFGDNMPAVRFPALLLGAGTSLITYLLTLKLFRSDRLALGAVLLNHLVPLFIGGSLLMTIDSPLFFCWGLATYLAAIAIFDAKRWPWPLIGLVVGIGALGKYAMLLWLPILGASLLFDEANRRILRSAGPWIACAFALLCMTPVIIWNQQHNWVTLRHVAHQTGATGGAFSPMNILSLFGAQIGLVGPPLAVLMIAAIVQVIRNRRVDRRGFFLASIGLGFFTFNLLASFHAKVEPNWPAPAFFTLTILTARFLGGHGADGSTPRSCWASSSCRSRMIHRF
jgi:undecaprenyl-diphosphatase